MAAVILETKGLSKRFGGLDAVRDVSFALSEGSITALIGPNGAGKTTLVGMISGRIEPSEGRIMFAGEDVSALAAHERIGRGLAYTFQITSVFEGLTLYENVALAAGRHLRRGTPAHGSKVEEVLARTDLADRQEQIAGDLSYGHQRMLEIAMGLAQSPRLFILDEPTQGLAEAEIAGFISLVKEIAGETTILLIEHNMPVVMSVAERIIVMDQGAVLASGTPEEIRANASVQAAYLGVPDA